MIEIEIVIVIVTVTGTGTVTETGVIGRKRSNGVETKIENGIGIVIVIVKGTVVGTGTESKIVRKIEDITRITAVRPHHLAASHRHRRHRTSPVTSRRRRTLANEIIRAVKLRLIQRHPHTAVVQVVVGVSPLQA